MVFCRHLSNFVVGLMLELNYQPPKPINMARVFEGRELIVRGLQLYLLVDSSEFYIKVIFEIICFNTLFKKVL